MPFNSSRFHKVKAKRFYHFLEVFAREKLDRETRNSGLFPPSIGFCPRVDDENTRLYISMTVENGNKLHPDFEKIFIDRDEDSDLATCRSELSFTSFQSFSPRQSPWQLDAYHDSFQKSVKWMRAWRARYFYELVIKRAKRLRLRAWETWTLRLDFGRRCVVLLQILMARNDKKLLNESWNWLLITQINYKRLNTVEKRIVYRRALCLVGAGLDCWRSLTAARQRRGTIFARLLLRSARRAMALSWAAICFAVEQSRRGRRSRSTTPERTSSCSPPATLWSRRRGWADAAPGCAGSLRRRASALRAWVGFVLLRRMSR